MARQQVRWEVSHKTALLSLKMPRGAGLFKLVKFDKCRDLTFFVKCDMVCGSFRLPEVSLGVSTRSFQLFKIVYGFGLVW